MHPLGEALQEWSMRGSGYLLWGERVALEPPFARFASTAAAVPETVIDDAQRPTLLSSLVSGVRGLFSSPPATPDEDELLPDILQAVPDECTQPVVELQIACPPDMKVQKEAVEQLLAALTRTHNLLAFEIIGLPSSTVIQMAVRDEDLESVLSLLKAYFPDGAVTLERDFLTTHWNKGFGDASVVVDFGLSQTFLLPLRSIRSFDVDPLQGILGALSDIRSGETACLQILFQGTRQPWAAESLGLLRAGAGELLFEAPQLGTLAERKSSHALFAALVRVAAHSSSEERSWALARRLGAALQVFADPASNTLVPLSNDEYDREDHEESLLSRTTFRSGMLLSSDELAGLVHPPSPSVRAPMLLRQVRKTKAAPHAAAGHEFILGRNLHGGAATEVSVSADQRSRHMYLIGASGTGKSTLLLNMILQDLAHGEGVAVLDPHGDLVDKILERMPAHRVDDVVLVDPSDTDFPIGFNVLSAATEDEKTLVISDLIAVFRRLSETWGDQMDSVFANAIAAFLESSRGGTIADMRRFLLDPKYRAEFLTTVTDPDIVYFWQRGFPLLSGRPVAPILTRLDQLLRPKPIRYMVGQRESRLDLSSIMNEGKVLLARLSHGAIGRQNAYLLGTLLVTRLQHVALLRQSIAEEERRPFYLYVDEFHNFVTPTMEEILSGARKYRLSLILAHQTLQQLASRDVDVLNAVLTNPGTRVCFRVGEQDAKQLEKGFTVFQREDLQRLGIGQAIVRLDRADHDFNLDVPAPSVVNAVRAKELRNEIVAKSRARCGVPRAEVEALLRRTTGLRELGEMEVTADDEPAAADGETRQVHTPRVSKARAPKRERVPEQVDVPIETTAAPAAPGHGGETHRYFQGQIKGWADLHGWGATLEEHVLEGKGSIDVVLRKSERSIACEVCVTTTPEHELANVQKCLDAGYQDVILILACEKKTATKIGHLIASSLSEEDRDRVRLCPKEEVLVLLDSFEASVAGTGETVRGRRVKATFVKPDSDRAAAVRQFVSGMIGKAIQRSKRGR